MDVFAQEFESKAHKDPPTAMYVTSGSSGRPLSNDWSLDEAVVHGYKASGWVYSCARILSTHVGGFEWNVTKPDSTGASRVVPNHDTANLIENPNEHQTRNFQMKQRTLHLCLCGNALDKIITVGPEDKKEPDEIWGLRPDSMKPIPDDEKWLIGWEVNNKSGRKRKEILDPEIVVHAQLNDPADPFWGTSPLRSVAKVVDMDVVQVDWNRNLVDNSAVPSGIYTDVTIKDPKRLKEVMEAIRRRSGPDGAGDPLVLGADATWQQTGISPKELDWVKVEYDSIAGTIRTHWTVRDNGLDLIVTVPTNSTAHVHVLAETRDSVEVPADAEFVEMEDGCAVFAVNNGTHTFKIGGCDEC